MRQIGVATVALLLAVGIAGCTQPVQPAPQEPSVPVATPTATPSSTADAPIDVDESASARERFDTAVGKLLSTSADPTGREVVDALVAAGFEKTQMELTPDTTAIGLDADSIQFSVRVGEDCIVGQSGNVGYHSTILPLLSTNTCLVGKTRAIDW